MCQLDKDTESSYGILGVSVSYFVDIECEDSMCQLNMDTESRYGSQKFVP